MKGKRLETIDGLPPDFIRILADRWIETAEQLVALGARRDGARQLARILSIPEAEAKKLIIIAQESLPKEVREAMESEPHLDRPLGLIFEEEEGKNGHPK